MLRALRRRNNSKEKAFIYSTTGASYSPILTPSSFRSVESAGVVLVQ